MTPDLCAVFCEFYGVSGPFGSNFWEHRFQFKCPFGFSLHPLSWATPSQQEIWTKRKRQPSVRSRKSWRLLVSNSKGICWGIFISFLFHLIVKCWLLASEPEKSMPPEASTSTQPAAPMAMSNLLAAPLPTSTSVVPVINLDPIPGGSSNAAAPAGPSTLLEALKVKISVPTSSTSAANTATGNDYVTNPFIYWLLWQLIR